jgi:hypothetical protein
MTTISKRLLMSAAAAAASLVFAQEAGAVCTPSSLNGDWRAYIQFIPGEGVSNHICSLRISNGAVTFIDCHQSPEEFQFIVTSATFGISPKCQIRANITGHQGPGGNVNDVGVNIDATLNPPHQVAVGFTLASQQNPFLPPFVPNPSFGMVKAPVILPDEW